MLFADTSKKALKTYKNVGSLRKEDKERTHSHHTRRVKTVFPASSQETSDKENVLLSVGIPIMWLGKDRKFARCCVNDVANVIAHLKEEIRIAKHQRQLAVNSHEDACKRLGERKKLLDKATHTIIEQQKRIGTDRAYIDKLQIDNTDMKLRFEAHIQLLENTIAHREKLLDDADVIWRDEDVKRFLSQLGKPNKKRDAFIRSAMGKFKKIKPGVWVCTEKIKLERD